MSEHNPKRCQRCLIARVEELEAQVRRVRERAEGPIPAVHGDWMGGYAAALRDICQALEGDSDE